MSRLLSRRSLVKSAAAAGGALALSQIPGRASAAANDHVVFATGTDAVTMDPHMATDIPSARAFMQIHENLVAVSSTGEVRGVLAERWETSSDSLTWTFHLRKGVSFTDGAPFNAETVKFNFDRLADPATGSPRRVSSTTGIVGVTIVDEHTVQYKTAAPMASLLSRLGHYNYAIISPKAAKAAGKGYAQTPVGTGAFKLSEHSPDEKMTFVRNDAYWGTKPKLKAVDFRVVPEDNTRVLMLLSGEAHLISNVTPVMVPRLKKSSKVRIVQVPSTRVIYIGMNRAIPPFDKPQVREAIAASIDSKALVDHVQRGFATLAGAFDQSFIPGVTELPPYKYDPDRAKKLLVEAGLPNGFTTDFYFTTGRYANDRQVAEAIQAQLAKVGIKLNMQSPEFGTYMGLLANRKKVPFFLGGKGNPAFDIDGGLANYVVSRGGMNFGNYSNPDMDKLVAEQRSIIDPDKRKAVLKTILDKIHTEIPELVLYYEQQIFGMQSNLNGVEITPNEYVSFVKATIA